MMPFKYTGLTSVDGYKSSVFTADYCEDPAYDAHRAAQANATASLISLITQQGLNYTTQAGCTCSPLRWSMYNNGTEGRQYGLHDRLPGLEVQHMKPPFSMQRMTDGLL